MKRILPITVLAFVVLTLLPFQAFAASTSKPYTVAAGATSNLGPSVVRSCGDGSGSTSAGIGYVGTDGHLNEDLPGVGGYNDIFNTTTVAPAIVCYNNYSYMAWTGTDGYPRIGQWNYNNVITLSGVATFSNAASGGPTLTVCNGTLYLGWVGAASPHYLNIVSDPFGADKKVTLTDYTQSNVGFALTCANNQVYAAWLASSGTPYFYIGTFTGSSQLSNAGRKGGDYSAYRPGISGNSSGNIEIFFKGYTTTDLYTAVYNPSNGIYYSAVDHSDVHTLYGPAVDYEFTAYTGTDHKIYYDSGFFF